LVRLDDVSRPTDFYVPAAAFIATDIITPSHGALPGLLGGRALSEPFVSAHIFNEPFVSAPILSEHFVSVSMLSELFVSASMRRQQNVLLSLALPPG